MTTRLLCAAMILAASAPGAQAQDDSLIALGAKVERVATGFGFVEGPAADADGNLYFSDVVNERIHRWTPDTGITVFRDRTGRANGLRVDLDGTLLVCEMANRQLTAIDPDGRLTILADRYEGNRFNSPNDLWVDPKGGIYFSDPSYGPTDDLDIKGNHVYYLSPDRVTLLRVTDDLVQPNGIIGTPDGSRVYIADQGAGRVWAYRPGADGMLSEKDLFVSQGADGLTMDERGNLYLTGQDITIFDPTGQQIASIGVPEPPANLAFGGPEGMTLFITARRSLYRVEMLVTGQ
jgi:gluconolactonase